MPINEAYDIGFGVTSPFVDIVPIEPSDANDLPKLARAIRCKPSGTGGALAITTFAGEVRTTEISAGETLPGFVIKVHATGTTAAGLEALI